MKAITGWPGYLVSEDGMVFTTKRTGLCKEPRPPKLMKLSSSNGYLRVKLRAPGKQQQKLVHRLVLETFVGPCPENCEASHLNGDRTDNRLENLAWETRQRNTDRRKEHGVSYVGENNPNVKLTDSQVREIRRRYSLGDVSQTTLGVEFGVNQTMISHIIRRTCWTEV